MHEPVPGFWSNFWAGLGSGLALLLLGKLLLVAQRFITQMLRMRTAFSIAGVWVGQCMLPSYRGEPAIEIYRIGIRDEEVRIAFFNYRPGRPAQKHAGHGIYRGKRLAAFYHATDSSTYEVGTFVVTLAENMLKGVYMQYDERASEQLFVSDDQTFSLARAHVSTFRYFKMLLGQAPYRTYQEAEQLFLSLNNRANIDPR